MQLSAIFADDGWELGEMKCGPNLAAVLIRAAGPVFFLGKQKLAKLEGLPAVHELGETKTLKEDRLNQSLDGNPMAPLVWMKTLQQAIVLVCYDDLFDGSHLKEEEIKTKRA